MNVDASEHFKNILKKLPSYGTEQLLIRKFINNVIQNGLFNANNSVFPGKISHSWAALESGDPRYSYAKENNLWHYHIGYQCYFPSKATYKCSEWIIHFIWHKFDKSKCNEIKLVDYTPHKVNGAFPQPQEQKLI